MSQTTTAMTPPGLTHRKPGCLTFGQALYSSENIRLTMTSSTGHFAMSQISDRGVADAERLADLFGDRPGDDDHDRAEPPA